MNEKIDFENILQRCEKVIAGLQLEIVYTAQLDPFYKGDLNGKKIFIESRLLPEEKLFNLLHLAGHSIQWNIDPALREMGSKLHMNPDDELLKKLQEYEWEATCFGLTIIHHAGIYTLDDWLSENFATDMLYLTHFYKTGEKLKSITGLALSFPFNQKLVEKPIPEFIPVAIEGTRNGLVISF